MLMMLEDMPYPLQYYLAEPRSGRDYAVTARAQEEKKKLIQCIEDEEEKEKHHLNVTTTASVSTSTSAAKVKNKNASCSHPWS